MSTSGAKAYKNGHRFEKTVSVVLKKKYKKRDGWVIFNETELKRIKDELIYPKNTRTMCQTFDFLCFNNETKERIFIYCQKDLFSGGSQILRASMYLSRDFLLRKRIQARGDTYLCIVETKHQFTSKSKYKSLFKLAEKDGIFKTIEEFKELL